MTSLALQEQLSIAVPADADSAVALDALIDRADAITLQGRWLFGQWLLSQRQGKKLPVGLLDDLCSRTGKSRSELQYRMQFAEVCDENALSNALDNGTSWRSITQSLATPPSLPAAESPPYQPRPAPEWVDPATGEVVEPDDPEPSFPPLVILDPETGEVIDQEEQAAIANLERSADEALTRLIRCESLLRTYGEASSVLRYSARRALGSLEQSFQRLKELSNG